MPPFRIVRRTGLNTPRLRGVRREGGPASLAPDQHWDVRNYVPEGGTLVPRGGQFKLNPTILPGMTAGEFFNGMFDETVGGSSVGGCGGGGGVEHRVAAAESAKLYWYGYTVGGIVPMPGGGFVPAGAYILYWDSVPKPDPDSVPAIDEWTTYNYIPVAVGGTFGHHIVLWNGRIYFAGTPSGLWSLPLVSGEETHPVPILEFADTGSYTYGVMRPWNGKLWIASYIFGHPTEPTRLFSWVGTGLPVEVDTNPAPSGIGPMGEFGDSLYIYYGADVMRRITNLGVLSYATMPGENFVTAGPPGYPPQSTNSHDNTFAVYDGALYVAGRDDNGPAIYKTTDGITFTLAHQVPGGVGGVGGPLSNVYALAVFNGYLYYVWHDATVEYLGRYPEPAAPPEVHDHFGLDGFLATGDLDLFDALDPVSLVLVDPAWNDEHKIFGEFQLPVPVGGNRPGVTRIFPGVIGGVACLIAIGNGISANPKPDPGVEAEGGYGYSDGTDTAGDWIGFGNFFDDEGTFDGAISCAIWTPAVVTAEVDPTALVTSRGFNDTTRAKVHLIEAQIPGVPNVALFHPRTIPEGTVTTLLRPAFVGVGHTTFILGMFDPILVKQVDGELYKGGISTPPAPGVPPDWNLTAAAGSTNYVGAIAYRHRMTIDGEDRIITESSMSPSTEVVTGAAPRTWSNLPTAPLDSRVTHIVGYLSIAGGEMQEAWEATIGTTSVVESTTAFGVVGNTAREPPPYGKYGEFYANCLWIGGNPEFPYRVYRSQIDEPEAFDGATGFLDLKDREIITGMKRAGDTLLVFANYATYAIQGFGNKTTDFTIYKISPSIGCISHHSIVNIHEWLWFLAEEGVCVWDGTRFRFMMKDLRVFFRDQFFANYQTYRNCHAVDNKFSKVYELLIPLPTGNLTYLGHYSPVYEEGQDQPDWYFKDRARYEYALGRMRILADVPRVYTSDTVAFIRQEGFLIDINVDDDGDTMARRCVIQTRHEYGEGFIPGGDERFGKTWHGLGAYFRCEGTPWSFVAWGGDESAIESTAYPFDVTVPASVIPPGGPATHVAKERHYFGDIQQLAGSGCSMRIVTVSPVDGTVYRGFEMVWTPGEQARLILEEG